MSIGFGIFLFAAGAIAAIGTTACADAGLELHWLILLLTTAAMVTPA